MPESESPRPADVIWSPEARADLRAIDRDTAMQILYCLTRYRETHSGDVKKLQHPLAGFRLRCGDYRLFFDYRDEDTIEITGIRHRKDAYR